MTTLTVRLTLLVGLGTFALVSPSAAGFVSGTPKAQMAGPAPLQLAQGATPEGWRKEGAPRYKKASARDTTMERCISVAQKEYPNSDTQSSERTARYKACMTGAGQRP